ncbi:hypothetical protein CYMTET_26162 [Cymbomonas tetramitiformis]|uniref:Uncharacterized protein n=1 Tax=Cymbomonas tetramitiformis TaxID=36881 RepID=A0AAE0FSB4_9CHLO|nr:hypothetical protein CYMTET_26162 [Cymbomonas tetramitiformis]
MPAYLGSVERHFEEYGRSEEEDELEYPLGYYDDSGDDCEAEEEEQHGHLATPYFSSERLEQVSLQDTGFQLILMAELWSLLLAQATFNFPPNNTGPLSVARLQCNNKAEQNKTLTVCKVRHAW